MVFNGGRVNLLKTTANLAIKIYLTAVLLLIAVPVSASCEQPINLVNNSLPRVGSVYTAFGRTFIVTDCWFNQWYNDPDGLPAMTDAGDFIVLYAGAGLPSSYGGTWRRYEQYIVYGTALPSMDLSATPAEIDPSLGGSSTISASMTSQLPYTWSVSIAGRAFAGAAPFTSLLWDGTDSSGTIVEPGLYQVEMSVVTNKGCFSKSVPVQVVEGPKSCPLEPRAHSTFNVASGNITHTQDLFATKGGTLPTAVSLTYKSLDSRLGALGTGWSHNLEIFLEDNGDGTILFSEGSSKRLYTLSGTTYVSQFGDTSTLVKNSDGTFTVTEMDALTNEFDATGRIISRTDRNGNSETFDYTEGKLSGVTDPASRTTNFSYNAEGLLASISAPNGSTYTFSYNGTRLAAVHHPDGGAWNYTYDDAGFLLTKTDPNGNVITYTYDSKHRVLTGTGPDGADPKSLVYPTENTSVRETTFTEGDGGNWTYNYNTVTGTLTSKTDPLGNTVSFTYDANRNMLSKTEPLVGTTRYTYDASNNMTSSTDPANNVTSYTYNSLGLVLTTSGPQGNTGNTYDDSGNLLTATGPDGGITRYRYDGRANLIETTNPLGQVTTYAYDDADLLASVTDPAGAVISYTYDPNGNMLTQTDPLGKVTTFTYDGMNRLLTVTDALGHLTTYGYDKMGNRTSVTDPNGNTSTYKFNYQGQMVQAKDAQEHTTTYTYGAMGCASCGGGTDKVTSITDAIGHITTYQYDTAGHLIQETDPLQKATSYYYDPAGNMDMKTDANGINLGYSYDFLKRLTAKSYPDGSSVNYTYDSAGRVSSVANSEVTYTYQYDLGGRVTGVSDSRGYRLDYVYDLAGNRTRMTFQTGTPDQRVTGYTYDRGRLTGITSPAGVFSYGYDAVGRRTSLGYPNQVVANYTYDEAGRLTGLAHVAANSTIAAFSYALDRAGNRTSKTATEAEQYLYDTVYKLLTVTSSKSEAFGYDAVGNRQSGPGAKDTGYLHNPGNQMIQGRKLSYGYDNNGNQTGKIIPAALDKSWTQTWDYENRLVKVEKVKGAEKRTVTFSYDAMGRRIGKVSTFTKGAVQKTSSWQYVYDNDNIVLEVFTENGMVTKTFYTHGVGTDEPLALERSGQYYFYHADGLGSVASLTDPSRNIVQNYEYDSFGMVKPQTSFTNSYAYTGREWDKETGLYYYRARYYDPMEGRFISKDPISFAGGDINLYGYVQGNPLNHTDSLGLSPDDVLNWARQQVGGGDYSLWSPNSEVRGGRGSLLGGRFAPKCNIFVGDALKAGHCEAGRVDGGRLPTASEWADPNFNIPGCSVVSTPEPGDVVSYHGHVGLYDPITPNLQGTISAAYPTPVVWSNWGFRDGQKPTFRRCTCSQ
jgi:RHS repeat-associated protein